MSEGSLFVIGADVGGTTTRIGLATIEGGTPVLRHRSLYPSREYGSLDDLIAAFLSQPAVAPCAASVAAACFAVAGPVEGGRARLTNLPWQPAETEIARRFRFPRVRIINDFAAAGLGVEQLSAADLMTLQAGTPIEHADRVVVGAGTGLGVALLDWDGDHYEVHASEAGHTDFAPVDAVQDALLAHLRTRFPRVSYERVLSGKGLRHIFDFLVDSGAGTPTPELSHALGLDDSARAISEFAMTGADALAQKTLDIFVTAYGSFAGNMALTMLAQGGVYVAGGIAPKIAAKLQDGTFMRSFTAKGRFYSFLESFPVHVVMNDQVGLYGALTEAARIATRA